MAAMSEAALSDPILARLKRELVELYGPRLQQVLLYGSRARGDFSEESDYDVLVVLEGPFHWWDEVKRLGRISSDVAIKSAGVVMFSLRPVTAAQIQERTGFMHNVRREAVPL